MMNTQSVVEFVSILGCIMVPPCLITVIRALCALKLSMRMDSTRNGAQKVDSLLEEENS